MFFSRKNNASSEQGELNSTPYTDKTLSETNAVQSAINMQIQDMKELSMATAAVIDKVKAMKIEEVNRQIQSIDSRLKNLESHIGEQDKALAALKSMPSQKQPEGDAEILEKAKAAACAASALQISIIDKRINAFEEKISSMEKRLASDESTLQKHLPVIESIDAPLIEKLKKIDASPADSQLTENAKKLAALEARLSHIDATLSEQEANRKKSYQLIESMEQILAEKIKKASSEEIGKRFEDINSHLKSLESNMSSLDKKVSSAQTTIKMEAPTIQKPATSQTYSPKAPEIKPMNPIQKSSGNTLDPTRPKESHIIETTMDREKKDTVKEAISSYEMRTITNKDNIHLNQNHKQNILESIVNQIIPASKKEHPESQKEKSDSTTIHNAALDAIAPRATPKKAPHYQDLKENLTLKTANVSKPTDASSSAAKLSTDIARAKQLVREKKYSDATEIYLTLINVLEDSKSDPSVKGFAPAIDELYEYISSSLLTNLSAPEEKEAATTHKQNESI